MTQREQPNNKLLYYEIALKRLVRDAENDGVIVTVERVSQQPYAMRNTVPVVEVREKR